MQRAIEFVDVPISEDRSIPFEVNERIVGISISNQGSNPIKVGMGSNNASKVVEAGADVEYGNINGGSEPFYLVGQLVIVNTGNPAWDNSDVVITYAYDRTGIQDC